MFLKSYLSKNADNCWSWATGTRSFITVFSILWMFENDHKEKVLFKYWKSGWPYTLISWYLRAQCTLRVRFATNSSRCLSIFHVKFLITLNGGANSVSDVTKYHLPGILRGVKHYHCHLNMSGFITWLFLVAEKAQSFTTTLHAWQSMEMRIAGNPQIHPWCAPGCKGQADRGIPSFSHANPLNQRDHAFLEYRMMMITVFFKYLNSNLLSNYVCQALAKALYR